MRVPNTGLDAEMRQIIRDGYRFAERLMRDYRDPPGLIEKFVADSRQMALGLYRAFVRG